MNFPVFVFLLITFAKGAYSVKSPSDLQKHLFENYNPKVIPTAKAGDKVPVTLELTLTHLQEIDEERRVLVMDAWLFMMWTDMNLKWNPSSYDGIKSINVPSTDIWRPDMSIYNASPEKNIMPVTMTNVILYENGTILWVPPLTIHAYCPTVGDDYPQDVLKCIIKVGSWTYGSLSFDLQARSKKVDLQYFGNGNILWHLESATVFKNDTYYDCCPDEFYATLDYSLTFRRQNSGIAIADAVACFAVFLSLLMFWMDPSTPHKIILGTVAESVLAITALTLGAVLQSPAANMKAAQCVIPLMSTVGVFLIVEVLIMNISKVGVTYRAPEWLLLAAKGLCQPFQICMSRMNKSGKVESGQGSKDDKEEPEDHWKLVAMALDRMAFFISVAFLLLIYNVL